MIFAHAHTYKKKKNYSIVPWIRLSDKILSSESENWIRKKTEKKIKVKIVYLNGNSHIITIAANLSSLSIKILEKK